MIFLSGCKSENPTTDSIVGVWYAEDGAIIAFAKDGTFFIENLLGNKFLPFSDDYIEKRFNETGKWKLIKEQGNWMVFLYLKKSNKLPLGCVTQIFISGSKGILENQPPWYLYLWEGEEGDARYKFSKKQ